jgi:hypothetical protein
MIQSVPKNRSANNITNTDPLLGPLQDNGGRRSRMRYYPASKAGTNTGCPATDQRSIARLQGGICDFGAFEFVLTNVLFPPMILR